jgi:hypothetical protein
LRLAPIRGPTEAQVYDPVEASECSYPRISDALEICDEISRRHEFWGSLQAPQAARVSRRGEIWLAP